MKKRHTHFFINDAKPVNFCGKNIGWVFEGSSYEIPFEIEPTKGEHDFNTCEGCQNLLKEITENLNLRFEGKGEGQAFPFCCLSHSNLTKINEFNRVDFKRVPEMVAYKIIYTNQHIINNFDTENWYKNITDYIEYAVLSFGQMPTDCGEPFYLAGYFLSITHFLNDLKTDFSYKKDQILEFINIYQSPKLNPQTDLNLLVNTYEKWLKIFPFEFSFFSHLKEQFEKQLPILTRKPEVNQFTGQAKVQLHTKNSLIETLIKLTNNLLTQINSFSLYEKGLLAEPEKIKLELIINERRLKLKKGYVNKSKNEEKRYRKMIKEWFKDEQIFIAKIVPLLKGLPLQPPNVKPELVEKTILFDKPETIDKLFIELKGFFPDKESDLHNALKGEKLSELLLFPHAQNKFVEVFKRLKYNGFLLSKPFEIKKWICSTFAFQYSKGSKIEVRNFNPSTVHAILTKNKGEPTKKERICLTDWLPYKSHSQLQREADLEKL